MQAAISDKLIAWNGLRIEIPTDWDARISGHRQLVFEKDFQPQLQIRWEMTKQRTISKYEEITEQFAEQLGAKVIADVAPGTFAKLKKSFGSTYFFQTANKLITGGTFLDPAEQALFFFQLFNSEPVLWQESDNCLASLQFQGTSETLWRIQDFSLTTPVSFILTDYTFGAGLSRLSFNDNNLYLQTCKLGPADVRLDRQSIQEIFLTLTGTKDIQIKVKENDHVCEGHRNPNILGQLFLRLRREKPFQSARLWHDVPNNRLLAVVLSSNRPIPLATTQNICSKYEIIQKKKA